MGPVVRRSVCCRLLLQSATLICRRALEIVEHALELLFAFIIIRSLQKGAFFHLHVAARSELWRQVLGFTLIVWCLHSVVLVLCWHAESRGEGIFLRLRDYILIDHLVSRAICILAHQVLLHGLHLLQLEWVGVLRALELELGRRLAHVWQLLEHALGILLLAEYNILSSQAIDTMRWGNFHVTAPVDLLMDIVLRLILIEYRLWWVVSIVEFAVYGWRVLAELRLVLALLDKVGDHLLSLGRLEHGIFATGAPSQLLLLRLQVQIPIQVLIEEGLRSLTHRFWERSDVFIVELTIISLLVCLDCALMWWSSQVGTFWVDYKDSLMQLATRRRSNRLLRALSERVVFTASQAEVTLLHPRVMLIHVFKVH